MKKRILILVLAVLVILPLFASCSGNGGKNDVTTGGAEEQTFADDEEDPGFKELLKKEDFGGVEFKILIMPDRKSWSFCGEEPADSVETEIYRRNSYVEEFYGVQLKFEVGEQNSSYFNTACNQCLFSDTAQYDLISPDYYYGTVQNGFFIDLAAMDEIRLENPYWVKGWNDNTTVYGKNFAAAGFFTLDPVAKVETLYVNDTMAEDLDIPSLYTTVKTGGWTLEKLNQYIALAKTENGDSNWDFNDTYGLCANLWSGRALMVASGSQQSTFKDGAISFDLTSEHNVDVFEAFYKMFNETDGSYYCGGTAGSAGYQPDGARDTDLFLAGRALFLAHSLAEIKTLSTDGSVKYSLYPMPKFDDQQEGYRSTILGTTIFGIMRNAKDKHMSCTLLEALCILSYEDVLPVYYDKMLQGRYSQNPETAEMMDLIRESVWVDFLFINSSGFNIKVPGFDSVAGHPWDLIAKKQKTFQSTMQTYADGLPALWRDFKEFYE